MLFLFLGVNPEVAKIKSYKIRRVKAETLHALPIQELPYLSQGPAHPPASTRRQAFL